MAAFAAIYLIWGVSFFAIREVVATVPPFLAAGLRFCFAGLVLLAWTGARGPIRISRAEFFSGVKLGAVMFCGDYGCIFWAEQRVPSGIAAVTAATIPLLVFCGEWLVVGDARPNLGTGLGIAAGFAGIVLLIRPAPGGSGSLTGTAVALLGAGLWSAGTLWSRRLQLPPVKTLSAGLQMCLGGIFLLAVSAVSGEWYQAHWAEWILNPRVMAGMLYLSLAASVVAYTVYIWLLSVESATLVATYAYVNPIVAILVGFWWGGERFSPVQMAGMALVVAGTAGIMLARMPAAPVVSRASRP
jgi:drug/metabolite transporter (DMT)-like permease